MPPGMSRGFMRGLRGPSRAEPSEQMDRHRCKKSDEAEHQPDDTKPSRTLRSRPGFFSRTGRLKLSAASCGESSILLRRTKHPVYARLPRGKPREIHSQADSYQRPVHPARFDQLNAAQVTDPEVICFISHHDMYGRNVQSPVFAEKGDPLCLKQMSAYGIHCYGIGSHDKPLVGPDVSSVKEVGSPSIKLRGEGTEDVQAGLSLYDGIGPYLAQGRTTLDRGKRMDREQT